MYFQISKTGYGAARFARIPFHVTGHNKSTTPPNIFLHGNTPNGQLQEYSMQTDEDTPKW